MIPVKQPKKTVSPVNTKLPKQVKPNEVRTSKRVGAGKTMMTADRMTQALKKRSPWYQSIMNPLQGGGARIPDPCGVETATFQFVKDGTILTAPSGYAGIRALSLLPSANTTDIATVNADCYGWQLGAIDATAANIGFGTGGSLASTTGASFVPSAMNSVLGSGSPSLASLARVVSSAIYVWYEGSLLNTAGDYVTYNNPAGIQSSSSTPDSFANLYGAAVSPIVQGRSAVARWLPLSRQDLAAVGSSFQGTFTQDYRSFQPANAVYSSTFRAPMREFGVIIRGIPNASFRYRIVTNVEFIPRLNQNSLFSVSPSPVDPVEENFCLDNLDIGDSGTTVPASAVGAVPSVSRVVEAVKKETSGPLSAVTGAVGFIGDILEVAGPLLGAII